MAGELVLWSDYLKRQCCYKLCFWWYCACLGCEIHYAPSCRLILLLYYVGIYYTFKYFCIFTVIWANANHRSFFSRIWSYCTVPLQIVFYFYIWLYCTVSVYMVFYLWSCWFVLELVFSSTVCLAVLNLLGSICLEYVNRFLFGVSRSKILHCSYYKQ